MKLILITLASLFTFLFAILAFLPSIKFTNSQRKKFPILRKLDGKQLHFFVAAIICAFLVAFTSGLKDYVAMQPSNELNQTKQDETNSQTELQITSEENPVLSNNNLKNPENFETNKSNVAQEKPITSKQIIKTPERTLQKTPKAEITKIPVLKPQSLTKARSLISQGKYNAAIIECDKILSVNSKNAEALSLKKWSQKQLEILNP